MGDPLEVKPYVAPDLANREVGPSQRKGPRTRWGALVIVALVGLSVVTSLPGSDLRQLKHDPMASYEPAGIKPSSEFKENAHDSIKGSRLPASIHRRFRIPSDRIELEFRKARAAAERVGWRTVTEPGVSGDVRKLGESVSWSARPGARDVSENADRAGSLLISYERDAQNGRDGEASLSISLTGIR
ncbi:MAG: hypothetical protein J7513_06945 [Solirubrobacteraceae bacterium]|nr:hypothetical protein [Solirubrobacteraceae bacterium]